jgi:hypothetical protein
VVHATDRLGENPGNLEHFEFTGRAAVLGSQLIHAADVILLWNAVGHDNLLQKNWSADFYVWIWG